MFKKFETYLANIVRTELEKFEAAAVADAKIIENDFKAAAAKTTAEFEKIVADLKAEIAKKV